MSLITETGTGSATSESYCSLADANAYHLARGNTTWFSTDPLITDANKEEALRRATDFMEQVYRLNWYGYRVNSTQALSWPRYEVPRADYNAYYDSNIVPTEVRNACAELALKAAGGDLSPDLAQRVVREKIDVLEVEYDKNSVQYTVYRAINNMLAPLLEISISGTFRKVIRT
jgi:hypothetical protein